MDEGNRAAIDDLYKVEGQAELIDGRIVRLPGHGRRIGHVSKKIFHSLYEHEDRVGIGEVHTATLGYVVPRLTSGRESFCADVSYYIGPPPATPMAFIDGPPTFAVEIRDEQDYGPEGHAASVAKRADYFEAGTLVVWDVDAIGELIHSYFHDNIHRLFTFARGQVADAEPAVPGWRLAVDAIFPA